MSDEEYYDQDEEMYEDDDDSKLNSDSGHPLAIPELLTPPTPQTGALTTGPTRSSRLWVRFDLLSD